MDALCRTLELESELLELLLFRLVETRVLLEGSELRYVARAAEEVERARQRACETDLLRAAAVARVDRSGDASGSDTLRQLAAGSREPWTAILRDHHDAMTALVAEIEVVAHQNAVLARAQRERAASPPPGAGVEVPESVRASPDPELARVAARAVLDALLGGAGRLRMPALLSFLR